MKANVNRYLKALRDLEGAGEPITSHGLMKAVGIEDTDRSTALDIAAGWISTLRRYGFLRILVGQKVDGPRRKLQVYQLTKWGWRYKKKAAPMAASQLKIAANPKRVK